MALTHWYFNVTTEQFIRAVDDPRPIDSHSVRVYVGDVMDLGVTFVETAPGNKVAVLTTISDVRMGVGAVGSSPATTATAGTASAAWEWPFTLPLNLAAVETLAGASGVYATVEFRITTAIGPKRAQAKIHLRPGLIDDDVADPAAPEIAVSRSEAAAVYVPKEWPAGMRMLCTTDSGRRFLFYPHDDGTFRGDEI